MASVLLTDEEANRTTRAAGVRSRSTGLTPGQGTVSPTPATEVIAPLIITPEKVVAADGTGPNGVDRDPGQRRADREAQGVQRARSNALAGQGTRSGPVSRGNRQRQRNQDDNRDFR